jgi:hypothetical protein
MGESLAGRISPVFSGAAPSASSIRAQGFGAVLAAIPTNSRRIPSRTALNIAPASRRSYYPGFVWEIPV